MVATRTTKLAESCRFHRETWIGSNVPATDDFFAIEALHHGWRTLYTGARLFGHKPERAYLAEGRATYYDRLLADAAIDFPRALAIHWQGRRGDLRNWEGG